MADEYGNMDSSGSTYKRSNYKLENGEILPKVQVRYKTFGNLNEARDNVLVVCHALTGNASLDEVVGNYLVLERRLIRTSTLLFVLTC